MSVFSSITSKPKSFDVMLEKTLIEYFQNIPHVVSVTLFGTFARNAATPQSDIDISVLFKRPHVPDPLQLIAWREEIGDLLHKEVDIAVHDYQAIDRNILKSIVSSHLSDLEECYDVILRKF